MVQTQTAKKTTNTRRREKQRHSKAHKKARQNGTQLRNAEGTPLVRLERGEAL
jgi:hypothetical protein